MLRKLRIWQKNDFPIKKRVQPVKKKKKKQEMAKSMKGYHEINENQENMQGKIPTNYRDPIQKRHLRDIKIMPEHIID